MRILASLKAFFGGDGLAPTSLAPAEVPGPAAQLAAYKVRMAAGFERARMESERFLRHYGEFTAFFYRPDFDLFLRKEVLDFWGPDEVTNTFLNESHWLHKHPFNFPGPFYAGDSDSCGTGPAEAPENIILDSEGREYVFRQPARYYELLCVLSAAAVEVFDSYSADGNDHWTYQACREWWRNRPQLLHELRRPDVIRANEGQAQRYAEYLRGAAELDLRRYCYLLENGTYPPNAHTALPAL